MASLEVYKNHFYIKYYDSAVGYSRRETTGLKATPGNKQQAKRKLKEFIIRRGTGQHLFEARQSLISFDDALDEYLELKSFQPKTKQIYKTAADHLTKVTGSIITSLINKNHIRLLLKRNKKFSRKLFRIH